MKGYKQNKFQSGWGKEFLIFAVKLYLASPTAFKQLGEYCHLPNIRTIRRWLRDGRSYMPEWQEGCEKHSKPKKAVHFTRKKMKAVTQAIENYHATLEKDWLWKNREEEENPMLGVPGLVT